MDEKQSKQEPERTQITPGEFMVNKTIDNLATANAHQAIEIANLKAQIQLLEQQQKQQDEQRKESSQPKEPKKKDEELEGDFIPKDEKKIEH